MSLLELEKEVQRLSPAELDAFTRWLDEYTANQWDTQFEADVLSGKLERLGHKADAGFEAGTCHEL
ncbi:MAG: hypothetical protein LBK99_17120 [Opitutaceae bacterium]|jgi:hypothetical protein|nr:hypothetical protein [Opitutaceae bacterium]